MVFYEIEEGLDVQNAIVLAERNHSEESFEPFLPGTDLVRPDKASLTVYLSFRPIGIKAKDRINYDQSNYYYSSNEL